MGGLRGYMQSSPLQDDRVGAMGGTGLHALLALEVVGVVEAGGRVLQVATKLFATESQPSSGSTPFAEGIVKMLAADPNPVALKLAGHVLNLWLQLVLDLLIKLDKKGTQLTHKVSIYMNCSHENRLPKKN